MGTEIAKPNNLEDVVRSKVRDIFANLIPDEALDEMVQKEWKRFTEDRSTTWGGNRQVIPSDLRKIVQEEIESFANENIKPKIRERLWEILGKEYEITNNGGDWSKVYDEATIEFIDKCGGSLIKAMMRSSVFEALRVMNEHM